MESPYVVRWGILGCGWISSEFAKDISDSTLQTSDCLHAITAVGSRDVVKAQDFILKYAPHGGTAQQKEKVFGVPRACGTYEEVIEAADVDIVYIGTINPSHFPLALQVIAAGKHCLVEKPACLTSEQWQTLSTAAKAKRVFLMEALWTRFLPLSFELEKELLDLKTIGDIKSVRADFSMAFADVLPATHRTLQYEAAGGPMFDLGPYILLPALVALYYNPANEGAWPDITSCMQRFATGVDLSTVIVLSFPKLSAMAILSTSFGYNSPRDERLIISGTKGEIVVHDGLSRITKMTIRESKQGSAIQPTAWEDREVERAFKGFGLNYEADAVGRCLRDGELECPRVLHAFTATVMSIMDEVRRQGGYALPQTMSRA